MKNHDQWPASTRPVTVRSIINRFEPNNDDDPHLFFRCSFQFFLLYHFDVPAFVDDDNNNLHIGSCARCVCFCARQECGMNVCTVVFDPGPTLVDCKFISANGFLLLLYFFHFSHLAYWLQLLTAWNMEAEKGEHYDLRIYIVYY